MKTAIQSLIEEIQYWKEKAPVGSAFKDCLIILEGSANNSLEKEKEQIIEAGNGGVLINFLHREKLAKMSDDELRDSLVQNTTSYGEMYYNQTYNQNK